MLCKIVLTFEPLDINYIYECEIQMKATENYPSFKYVVQFSDRLLIFYTVTEITIYPDFKIC